MVFLPSTLVLAPNSHSGRELQKTRHSKLLPWVVALRVCVCLYVCGVGRYEYKLGFALIATVVLNVNT